MIILQISPPPLSPPPPPGLSINEDIITLVVLALINGVLIIKNTPENYSKN